MGVRIEVREDEPIAEAIRRFQKLVYRHGPPGKRPRWHKNQLGYYLKPSTLRRRKELLAKNETFRGECGRRHLVSQRFGKHRRIDFSRYPIVASDDRLVARAKNPGLSRL
jgi:ribosomal protein S21